VGGLGLTDACQSTGSTGGSDRLPYLHD